jgi:hypothetical protein
MQTIETALGEVVLNDYFPTRLKQECSATIYKEYVGVTLPEDKLYVVLGTDSALLVKYIQEIATTGQRFICVDFPEVISFIKKTVELEPENKIEFYSFEEFNFELLYEQYQDYVIRNAIILLKSLIVDEGKGLYNGVYRREEENFHRFRIDRVDNRNFKNTFDQQIANVCDLMHPLHNIKDQLKGDVPGIVLGGGPSLDDVIPWLKNNQGKVWIFAASRICNRLLKEGIVPDFIATLDPQELIFEYSKEMYHFADKSILITGEHPYPRLIQQWKGLKTYTRRRFPWAMRSEENFISDGPTVTNAMFGMAVYLGVSKIYLAGVDFCFTLDGVCHESSSIESNMGIRDRNDTFAINYRGERVGTNIQLYDARNLFEEELLNLSKTWTNLQAINLNSGAAVINGIPHQALDSVRLENDKFDVIQVFKPFLDYDIRSQKTFLKLLTTEINFASKWLDNMAKKAKKGLHLTSILFKTPKKQQERIHDVLKLKKQLEIEVGPDYQTMVNYAYTDFMQSLTPVESEESMSQQEMVNALSGFFGGLKKGSEGFIEQLNLLKEEIEFRKFEIDENTGFTDLTKAWLSRNIPGKFYVWLEHLSMHNLEYYQNVYPAEVKMLETAFNEMLHDNSKLVARFKTRLKNPQEYITQINKSCEQNLTHPIEKIISQLGALPKETFEEIQRYAEGVLFEMQNLPEKALIKYLEADLNKTKPYVLKRLFSLAFSLKEFELGLECLENLCKQDIQFLPTFAESLALLGNVIGAIEVLKTYPLLMQDTAAFINLLKLYIQAGQVEQANVLLTHVESHAQLDQKLLQQYVDSLNAKT